MATENQIAANRLNAQKCTGPTSPEGKARSSQNAFKTGIDSKAEVIRTENAEAYIQLTEAFNTQYAPANPAEQSVVDDLIRCEWLSRRYMAIEAVAWESRLNDMQVPDLGYAFLSRSQTFARAGQLYRGARRCFSAALKELRLLRAERQPNEISVETPVVAPDSPRPPSDEIGAVESEPTQPLTPELVSLLEFPSTPESNPPTTQNPTDAPLNPYPKAA